MKIKEISILNVLGIKDIDLTLEKPITLFTGLNGAGKSSIQEAIKMAFNAGTSRVSVKKNYDQILNNPEENSLINIVSSIGTHSIQFPSGKHKVTASFPDTIKYVLNPELFEGLKQNIKEELLIELTGKQPSTEDLKKFLEKLDLNQKKLDSVLPLLRIGIEAPQAEAKKNASDARTSWKAITGENYGDVKAKDWKPESLENGVATDTTSLESTIAQLETALESLQHETGKAAASKESYESREVELTELQEKMKGFSAFEVRHHAAELYYKQISSKISEVNPALEGIECTCPQCASILFFRENALFPKETTKESKNTGLEGEYIKAKENLEALNQEKLVFEQAKTRITELESLIINYISEDKLVELESNISDIKEKIKEYRAQLDESKANNLKNNQAKEIFDKATAYYHDVVEWNAIAEALSPEGEIKSLLSGYLSEFNKMLGLCAQLSGWKIVQIYSDMSITYGDRNYSLLSESEKWRVNCMLAVVISHFSGIKMFMIDRMDVLDTASRSTLLHFLNKLFQHNIIDSAILCGTLKQAPNNQNLPEFIHSYWVENGKII